MKILHIAALAGLLCASVGIGLAAAQGTGAPYSSASSSGRGVKVLWWNPSKGPLELTPQDISGPASAAFDGFILARVFGSRDNPKQGLQLAWNVFDSKVQYSLTDQNADYIGDSLAAMKALPSSPMPDRFLRVNAAIYHSVARGFDWTDDGYWNAVTANLRVAAQFAHDAGLRGIFLDTESYDPQPYNYAYWQTNPRYAGMSYEDVAAIVENRGRQVIQAINSAYPDIKIIVTFGYTTMSQHVARAQLPRTGALLAPFLDGMLVGSTPATKFIDGFEESYWHDNNPQYFSNWADVIKGRNKALYNIRFQKYPARYAQQYQAGFALFLDRDRTVNLVDGSQRGVSGFYGWCGNSKPSGKVFYSPARLAYTVQQAVAASDGYVWVYTQKPNAWVSGGAAGGLAPAYAQAIAAGARAGNGIGAPIAQDTSDAPDSMTCQ